MIEADLQRHYSVDLCDFWRGKLTPRKVRVLIDGLPPDSRTAYALGGSEERWSLTNQLLARSIDEIAALRWAYGFVHRDPKKPAPQFPDPVRPRTAKAAVVPIVSPHSMAALTFVNSEDFKGVPA